MNRFIEQIHRISMIPSRWFSVRIALTLFLIAIPLVILQIYVVNHGVHYEIERQSSSSLRTATQALGQLIDHELAAHLQTISLLATAQVMRDAAAQPDQQRYALEQIRRQSPEYSWIGLLEGDGRVRAATHGLLEGSSLADQAWFLAARWEPYLGPPVAVPMLTAALSAEANPSTEYMAIAVPIYTAQDVLSGVLVAQLDWQWMQQRMSTLAAQQSPGVEVLLIQSNRHVLFGSANSADLPPAGSFVSAGTLGTSRIIWPDGAEYVAASYALDAGMLDWQILLRQPTTAAFGDADLMMRYFIWGTLGLLVLLVFVSGAIVSRMTRPIQAITASAEQMSAQASPTELPVVEGNDELAQMSDALSRLVAKLKQEELSASEASQQAQQRLERVQALRRIDLAISARHTLASTMRISLAQVCEQLKVDMAQVWFFNRANGTLRWGGRYTTRDSEAAYSRVQTEKIVDYICRTGRFVQVPDCRNLNLLHPALIPAFGSMRGAYYGAPLEIEDEVIGVLEVMHGTALRPDVEWLSFFDMLAGQIAIATSSAGLVEQLRQANGNLIAAYDTTLEGWSRALDLRDKETEGHSQRVTNLTMELARRLGVDAADLVHVRRGALLHDIGKMGVPDAVLLKPGKLNDEEWAIIKRHPIYSYELLSPIGFLRPALDIPYAHHEKWDGTGYPQGLKGEAIPLAARVFAVIDVWDALVNERPYKPAWPVEKAREHILSQAGKHFDPTVVEAFIAMIDLAHASDEVVEELG